MSNLAPIKTGGFILSSTSNAAGNGIVRQGLDCRTFDGLILTCKITNGATGPTLQGTIKILISHSTGPLPTFAAEGAEWHTLYDAVGGGTNSVSATPYTAWACIIPEQVQHVEIEYGGNTGQAVTFEVGYSAVTGHA